MEEFLTKGIVSTMFAFDPANAPRSAPKMKSTTKAIDCGALDAVTSGQMI